MTINQDLIDRLRQLPVRAQQNMKTRFKTELGPELEALGNDLMKDGPLPVSDPFIFGSTPDAAKHSHDAYMAILRNMGIKPQAGLHWERTHEIEQGWRAEVNDRFGVGMIVIRNIQPKGKYVYGPFAVPGHIATGWTEQAQTARALLVEKVRERLEIMWHQSVYDAMRGEE